MSRCQVPSTSKCATGIIHVITIHFDTGNKVSKRRDEKNNPQKVCERVGNLG